MDSSTTTFAVWDPHKRGLSNVPYGWCKSSAARVAMRGFQRTSRAARPLIRWLGMRCHVLRVSSDHRIDFRQAVVDHLKSLGDSHDQSCFSKGPARWEAALLCSIQTNSAKATAFQSGPRVIASALAMCSARGCTPLRNVLPRACCRVDNIALSDAKIGSPHTPFWTTSSSQGTGWWIHGEVAII